MDFELAAVRLADAVVLKPGIEYKRATDCTPGAPQYGARHIFTRQKPLLPEAASYMEYIGEVNVDSNRENNLARQTRYRMRFHFA